MWKNESDNKNFFFSLIKKQTRFAIAWTTIILILGTLAVLAYTGIQLYQTYTSNKQIEMALEYSKDKNYEVEIVASNGGKCAFNVTKGNSPSALSLMQGSAISIRVIPRSYIKEYFKPYPNQPSIEPYSIDSLYIS